VPPPVGGGEAHALGTGARKLPVDREVFSSNESRKFQKRPPIGIEVVYDENSDYRGKKTNRMEKKHKVY
jgi:hypothetical protein